MRNNRFTICAILLTALLGCDAVICSSHHTVVLLDFTAKWCGPCIANAPAINEIERDGRGRVRVDRIDVDERPALAQRYRITDVPTYVVLVDGREIGRYNDPLKVRAKLGM